MRIGLNAHLLSFGTTYRGGGISRYIRNLIVHLRRRVVEDSLIVFLGDRRLPPGFLSGENFATRFSMLPTANPWARILWEQFLQPVELRRYAVDLLHSMGFVSPILNSVPSVVTIYDLSFDLYPGTLNRLNRLYLRLFTRLSVAKAIRVIAISQSTKRDTVEFLGVPEERVDVVYPGIESHFRPIDDPATLRDFQEQIGILDPYVLYMGTIEPRKNLGLLVRAFAKLRRKLNLPHKLVLAGPKGWQYEPIFRVIEEEAKDQVLMPGYISSQEQALWYNCADLFIYPSLYEGFGFPPLEAMACGVPVIVSDAASLPEVVGDAGLLVNSEDENGLVEAMERVLTDRDLHQALAAKGLRRAQEFSWETAAEQTLYVYRRSLSEASRG